MLERLDGGAEPGVVHVVGIGDDGPAGLSQDALAIVESAELLCGGERHLAFFPEHQAERFSIKSNVGALCERLAAGAGRLRCVVLASGDPCFFGIGPIIAARLGRERVRIHPQPGSVSLAFARLGLSWQNAAVLSAHGRPLRSILPAALAAPRFALLTDPWNTPARVAAALIDAGMEDAPAYVLEHLGGAEERTTAETLSGIARREFSSLNVLVVDRDPAQAERPAAAFGLREEEYESERGQITKAEVRAVTLAKLLSRRVATAWDVGAGSGSLAIELAGLMPAGRVYAVERAPAQLGVLRRNLARHPRPNLCLVAGEAPAALEALPAPGTVFVGGAGTELPAVLEAVACALRPGGRLVANFARLESLASWQELARRTGWEHELVQILVSRGAAIGEGTRLAPLGPVFICTLQRPAPGQEAPER